MMELMTTCDVRYRWKSLSEVVVMGEVEVGKGGGQVGGRRRRSKSRTTDDWTPAGHCCLFLSLSRITPENRVWQVEGGPRP